MTTEAKVRPWLLIILAIVIIIGGGFTYWYVKGNKETATIKTSPTPTLSAAKKSPTASPTASPIISPTPYPTVPADWKTYTNTDSGFSLKYPKDWALIDYNPNPYWMIIGVASPNTQKYNEEFVKKNNPTAPGYSDIVISYFPSLEELKTLYRVSNASNLKELIDKCSPSVCRKIKETRIGNLDAIEAIEVGEGDSYTVYFEHNTHIYKLSFQVKENPNSLSNEDLGILSTFQFTQ